VVMVYFKFQRINDITYKIDLSDNYDVSATFNVVDLTLFDIGVNSRSNSFEERGMIWINPYTLAKTYYMEALNELVLQVSVKTGLKDPLEHQEAALVHLIHVQEGTNPTLFGL